MPSTSPARSLSRQLVAPVVGLVLAAVLANVGFAAWLAVRRTAAAASRGQEQVAAAIRDARVAVSPQVLDTLRQLTGDHFIVWNPATRTAGLATVTLPDEQVAAVAADVGGVTTVAGRRYRIGITRTEGVRPEAVLMLTPVASPLVTTLESVWPVLAVAAATLAILLPLGLRTTGRLANRIVAVETQVARIAAGEFGRTLPDPAATAARPDETADEIDRLVRGVNTMSLTLETLRERLVSGERQRLLGQLAAGFAHELRNAITGATLAIDLHRRRCPSGGGDESLAVAVRQLGIVEAEVRGLLDLGRPATATPATDLEIDPVLLDVRDLVAPRCEHAGVRLECHVPTGIMVVGRRDQLRTAVVNLALNAIDAAGRGGCVRLAARVAGGTAEIAVEDSGEGPPEAIRDTLLEPFVTGKPEGIGLGLAVARAVAEEHGGRLDWGRHDGRTRFAILLPAGRLGSVTALPAAADAEPGI
jgi:signal transduction histidine kinase